MDLPGLNEDDTNSVEKVQLGAGCEWRFEVDFDIKTPVKLKLITGTAEIFGTELAIGAEYTFRGIKAAVFTWKGCEFEYSGEIASEYTSEDTPMSVYANLHFALENQRSHNPPNVMVLGPRNSGKTALCKILASYGNKGGEHYPMYVNLDPTEGVFAVPGALTAAPISDILDVENGWGMSQINGPSLLHSKNPLVYFYGLESPHKNAQYYKQVCSRLALGVQARLDNDRRVAASGVIIDTPASLTQKGDDTLGVIGNMISDFNINVVVVVGHERLYSEIAKKFKKVTALKVAKSGGVVDRDDAYMRQIQKQSIHDYFYGSLTQPLAPYTATVDYSMVTVYRVNEDDQLDDSVLPIGAEQTEQQSLVKLEPSSILQTSVMAVMNANISDPPETVVQAEVLGFVHVVEANDERHKLKILMPVRGKLPDRPFIIGDYRYHE